MHFLTQDEQKKKEVIKKLQESYLKKQHFWTELDRKLYIDYFDFWDLKLLS